MSALIITYDLSQETKRPAIVQEIKKKWPTWAKLSESSYAVATADTAQAVYDALSHNLDGNDQLYVINLRKPYAGWGPNDVNTWLENNLPRE